MTIDIKNFYLNTPMDRPEFMKLKLVDIPDNIVEQYDLKDKVTKEGYVYVQISHGMYGLPQAGMIAQQLLKNGSTHRGTHKAQSPQVSGHTNGDPFHLL
jgi:hypothetical protein